MRREILMERLAQLEEETIRMRTTMKLKEKSPTHTELITFGKSQMSTREPSLIFEAYNAVGNTQLAQILEIIQDGGAAPFLAQLN